MSSAVPQAETTQLTLGSSHRRGVRGLVGALELACVVLASAAALYVIASTILMVADNALAKKLLHWEPKVTFDGLVKLMTDYDLELAKHEAATRELKHSAATGKTRDAKAERELLKGAERRHFMTSCLNGTEVHKLTAHQQMNETCTRQADERKLDGAARRGFMSDCVKPERIKQQTAEHVKLRNCHRRAAERKLDGADKEKFVAGCLDGSSVVGG